MFQGQRDMSSRLWMVNLDIFKTTKNSFSITKEVTPNGKSVIKIDNSDVFVCTGEKSLLVYDISNLSSPYKTISSLGDGFVNGVHCDKDFVS
jgi:hypothetical protein